MFFLLAQKGIMSLAVMSESDYVDKPRVEILDDEGDGNPPGKEKGLE